jgi:hypothetical protein
VNAPIGLIVLQNTVDVLAGALGETLYMGRFFGIDELGKGIE